VRPNEWCGVISFASRDSILAMNPGLVLILRRSRQKHMPVKMIEESEEQASLHAIMTMTMTMTTPTRRNGSGGIIATNRITTFHTNTSHCSDDTQVEEIPTKVALILGGWSPGPLSYLASFLHDELGYALLQPAIEMPPITWGWCCHSSQTLVLLLVVYGVFVWIVRMWWFRDTHNWRSYTGEVVMVLLGFLAVSRLIVALAVHSSMRYNVELCRQLVAKYNASLIVGFSWGGAVAAEVLAADACSARMDPILLPPPAFLLLAPTTDVVARLNLWQPRDAASRIITNHSTSTNNAATTTTFVSVVHAMADSIFCPHPERWNGGGGNESCGGGGGGGGSGEKQVFTAILNSHYCVIITCYSGQRASGASKIY